MEINWNKTGAYAVMIFAALFSIAVIVTAVYLAATHHIDLSSRY